MAEVKAKYQCTQVELYAIEKLAIDNLANDLDLFTAESTNYNAALVTTLRGFRTTTMALPNEEQRNQIHQTLGNKLPGLVAPIKKDFNILKQLIIDAWPGEDPKPRWESAGMNNYNDIGEKNWEEVVELNNLMTAFISNVDNAAKLTSPGGMVAGFPAQAGTNFTAFNDVYGPFLSSRETSTARAAKINADNKLFEACSKFRNFAVTVVFANDDDNKKRYTFKVLKDIVSPPGSASLKVTVKKKGTNEPLADVSVTIQSKTGIPKTLRTGTDGIVVFENIDPDDYTVKVVAPGLPSAITVLKEVNTGTAARLEVEVD